MKPPLVNRRAILRALGLATAGAGTNFTVLPRAHAAGEIPKRVLFFYTFHGTYRRDTVRGLGANAPTETEFEIGPVYAPLAPHKKKIVLVSGLDYVSRKLFGGAGNPHDVGGSHAMAPYKPVGSPAKGGGISIDRFIAQELNKGGLKTPLPYVYARSGNGYGAIAQHAQPVFTGPGQPGTPDTTPGRLFDRLMGAKPNFGGGGSAPPAGASELVTDQRSLLDFVGGEMRLAAQTFGKEDKIKVEQHADRFRDLEQRLTLGSSAGPSCRKPEDVEAMATLMQMAFACDLTRVATLVMSFPGDVKGMHDLAHDNWTASVGAGGGAGTLGKAYIENANGFAKLLSALDAVPERDGKKLLDHCAVVWCGEISTGQHHHNDHHWVLAGGANGAFKTGRHLRYIDGGISTLLGPAAREDWRGVPHGNLWVSIANIMGVNINTFGDPGGSTGRLARL